MALDEEIATLTRGMLRKKLYVVLSRGKGADLKPHLPDHLRYMIALEKEGKLFASGPFDMGTSGDGMTILRVESAEEAGAIAERDPFVVNRIRTFEIREWTLMEGSFGINVNFSDRSISIE
jgi:uncharacterized protein YciI